jgi:hypothetical protein
LKSENRFIRNTLSKIIMGLPCSRLQELQLNSNMFRIF